MRRWLIGIACLLLIYAAASSLLDHKEQPELPQSIEFNIPLLDVPDFDMELLEPTHDQEPEVPEMNLQYIGNFRISHYCPCPSCNGKWTTTASGHPLTPGVTIAVDRNVIPLGSTVEIDGYGIRVAHDTGSAIKGNRIDVLVKNHSEADDLGIVYRDVYLKQ